MEQAGARRLSVIDLKHGGFVNDRTLGVVRGLSTVESASAVGVPFDGVNGVVGAGGVKVPVWPVLGDVAQVSTVVRGRVPQSGEALVSTGVLRSLNLTDPVGYLTSTDGLRQYPIVGSFTPLPPFEEFAAGAIVAAPDGSLGRELRVVIDDIAATRATVSTIMGVLAPADPEGVRIESPTGTARTAQDVNAKLAGFGRTLLLLILGAGGLFVAAVVLSDVLIRRRDLGRRRTLGITRADLVALAVTRTLFATAIGSIVGCSTGWAINWFTGSPTPVDFVVAVGVLGSGVAALAALVPAVHAARLDPVRVMHTP